jgi:hypothetical protein
MNTSGEPDDGKSITSGSVGGTRKPTAMRPQGGGCLPYDISAIYLFLEGELVGEAYCTELLGQPMSIWEAQARRKADTEQAKEASKISLENRQRIQQEASSGRRALSLETRRLEKQRLLEQQRPEIHPAHVQAALRVLAHQQSTAPTPPPQPTGLLPPAVPEDDAPTTPIVRLQIRKRRSDDG